MTAKKAKAVVTKPKPKRRNPVIEGLKRPPEQLAIREPCLKLADRLAAALRAGDHAVAVPVFEALQRKLREWIRKNNR